MEIERGRGVQAASREGLINESLDQLQQGLEEAATVASSESGQRRNAPREADAGDLLAELGDLRRALERAQAQARSQTPNGRNGGAPGTQSAEARNGQAGQDGGQGGEQGQGQQGQRGQGGAQPGSQGGRGGGADGGAGNFGAGGSGADFNGGGRFLSSERQRANGPLPPLEREALR